MSPGSALHPLPVVSFRGALEYVLVFARVALLAAFDIMIVGFCEGTLAVYEN